MAVLPARPEREPAGTQAHVEWRQIAAQAPQMAATMGSYLRQVATFLAPLSIDVADNTLRQLSRFLLAHTTITAVGDVRRDDIESFKVWLAAQPGGASVHGCGGNGYHGCSGDGRRWRQPYHACAQRSKYG